MKSRASGELLDAIHGLLAGALKGELERAIEHSEKAKEPVPISPQLLDKVMKFLKDNGVDAPKSCEPIDQLAMTLAGLDVDLDEEASNLRH